MYGTSQKLCERGVAFYVRERCLLRSNSSDTVQCKEFRGVAFYVRERMNEHACLGVILQVLYNVQCKEVRVAGMYCAVQSAILAVLVAAGRPSSMKAF